MANHILTIGMLGLALATFIVPVEAGVGPPSTCCYVDGVVYRTVAPPAATPGEGRDNIYAIDGGVDGQLPVSASAPGDSDYDGGSWAVHMATWTEGSEPSLLTSEEAVLAAAAAGDLSIVRNPDADFRCPLQP
jgi:hypothetical protein